MSKTNFDPSGFQFTYDGPTGKLFINDIYVQKRYIDNSWHVLVDGDLTVKGNREKDTFLKLYSDSDLYYPGFNIGKNDDNFYQWYYDSNKGGLGLWAKQATGEPV